MTVQKQRDISGNNGGVSAVKTAEQQHRGLARIPNRVGAAFHTLLSMPILYHNNADLSRSI
jgi:hypothetical protein